MTTELLLGNGAMAVGLLESGCEVATAYPGTPSTEILEELQRLSRRLGIDVTTQWSVNEKVAFDLALAASLCGKRAACAMKQVGLNVASDSLLSAAYTGIVGGFVLLVADDPGPHSSQTEQDTRLFALFAKVPVLDPSSPLEARAMVREAFEISERHRVPVIVRPTTRVCHARQPVPIEIPTTPRRPAKFVKEPGRWAATPKFRLELHRELNGRLDALRNEFANSTFNSGEGGGTLGIIAAGHAWAVVRDVLAEEGRRVPVLKIGTPYPLPVDRVMRFVDRCQKVLVLEEPDHAIEIQIPDRRKIRGRLTGDVPPQGELTPEAIAGILGIPSPAPPAGGPPPRLCLGCGHRAAFFAIRKALPNAIFSGDIGCYTLGVNQRALDTCIDMGASITLADGFHLAKAEVPIVAIIGDSTFFHAGLPALLNAVTDGARILVVVMDNGTVAMTGGQAPPPGADIEKVARGIGVQFVETIDPYQVDETVALVKRARAFTKSTGLAMIIARRPCALAVPPKEKVRVDVNDLCDGCDYCLKFCECPALVKDPVTGKVFVDHDRCIDCGMCISMCPLKAIQPVTA